MADQAEIPINVPNIPANEGFCSWPAEKALAFARQATVEQNKFYAINAGVKYLKVYSNEEIEAAFLNTFDRPAVVEIAPTFNRQFGIEQRKIAKKMRKMIRKRTVPDENGHVFLNNIYIMALPKESDAIKIPVFYFKDKDGTDQYLDLQARVYKDFNNFLENNVIEPALCCYPVNGHYGQIQTTNIPKFDERIALDLAIYKSPAGGDLQTLIRLGQTWLKYGAYGVMVVSVVTQATSSNWFLKFRKIQKYGPFLKDAAEVVKTGQKCFKYANAAATIASSMFSVIDKWKHTDDCPITEITLIVSTVMDLLSDDINKGIVMLGLGEKDIKTATFDDLSWKTQFFLHLFSASRCAASIISLVTVVVTMLYKEKCTVSDYFNFSSSLFTCYGTLTSPLTAEKIFKQIQTEYLQAENAAKTKQDSKPKPLSKRLSENCNDAKADTVTPEPDNNENEAVNADSERNGEDNGNFNEAANDKSNSESSSNPRNLPDYKQEDNQPPPSESSQNPRNLPDYKQEDNQPSPSESSQNPRNLPAYKEESSDQTSSKYTKTDRVGPRSDSPINKEEIDKDLKEIRKKCVKDDNDEAGKEALKYFDDNILSKFKGTDNEYVVKNQIVRAMKQVDDPRLLFCEIALTKTVIDVKDGLLLINGQLRIDGAALGDFRNNGRSNADLRLLDKINNTSFATTEVKSDTEKIFSITKACNDEKQKLIEKYQKEMDEYSTENQEKKREEMKEKGYNEDAIKRTMDDMQNKKNKLEKLEKGIVTKLETKYSQPLYTQYRLISEVRVEKLDHLLEELNLTDYTINGEKVIQNLTLHEKFRLLQQIDKHPNDAFQNESITAAFKIAQECGYGNGEMIAATHQHLITKSIDHCKENMLEINNQTKKEFFQLIINDGDKATKVANDFKNCIEKVEEKFIEIRESNQPKTNFDHRFDIYNEDSKTVAAIAFVHANEYKDKNRIISEDRNFAEQIQATVNEIKKSPGKYHEVLTQDGKSYRHVKK